MKQGLVRFRCLFLYWVRRETGVGAIRRNFGEYFFQSVRRETRDWRDLHVSLCVRSGVKQGLELFEGIVFVLFLSLVRRETGVGAIRENGLCHRSLVKQASGSPAQ